MRSYILKIYCVIVALISSTSVTANVKSPDFAYPQTVSKQADKDLKRALKKGDSEATMRALIDWSIAQTTISPDNISNVITRIEKILSEEKNPCTCALLNTLLIDIYTDLYNNNQWQYDQREIPLLPLPDDYTEWSGEQFKYKVFSLSKDALSDITPLQSAQLKEYADIVTTDEYTFIFYPTLYDFIANSIITNLSDIANINCEDLPVEWRSSTTTFINSQPTSDIGETELFINQQYQQLLQFHQGNPAPYINCDLNRIRFAAMEYDDCNDSIVDIALKELYNKTQQSEYATLVLFNIIDYSSARRENEDNLKWVYNDLQKRLELFPNFFLNDKVEYLLKKHVEIAIDVETPRSVALGDSLKIDITNDNATNYTINIYRINDKYIDNIINSTGGISLSTLNECDTIQSIDFNTDKIAPFKEDTTIYVKLNLPGYYVVTTTAENTLPAKTRIYEFINYSNYHLFTTTYDCSQSVYVVNPKTGKPAPNVPVLFTSNNRRNQFTSILTTNENGAISDIKFQPEKIYTATVNDSIDHYSNRITFYISSNHKPEKKTTIEAKCFTALPIYHHGDTAQWSAILYSYNSNERKLLKDFTVKVLLYDANYQKINEVEATTDEFGRICGEFHLPKQSLSGRFTLSVVNNDTSSSEEDYTFGEHRFEVSDYKLPTFQVSITDIERGTPSLGDVTIKGFAKTYSGFPIADGNVELILSSKSYLWTRATDEFYHADAKTSADGSFSFEIPAAILSEDPNGLGLLSADITITSISGETQSSSREFRTGTKYILTLKDFNATFNAVDPIKFDIEVVDLNYNKIDTTLYYDIYRNYGTPDSTIIKSGSFNHGQLTLNLSDVPSGEYMIVFHLNNQELAKPVAQTIVLYRFDDPLPPTDRPLWVPTSNYEIYSGNSAEIIYGTIAPSGYVLYTLYNNDSILEQRWLNTPAGIHHLNVALPDSITNAHVSLMTTYNYSSESFTISVTKKVITPEISIVAESFRDNIIPGGNELWSFRVANNDNQGVVAAMLFDMYSKAIEDVAPNNIMSHFFNLNFNSRSNSQYFGISSQIGYSNNYYISENIPSYGNFKKIVDPDFNTYGINLAMGNFSHWTPRMSGATLSLYNSASAPDALIVEDEEALDFAVATGQTETKLNYAVRAVYNEDDYSYSNQHQFSYRDAETPLAFFRPMLTTDKDGHLTFSFIAPNANTTWRFKAIAYTSDLLTATFNRDIISNKPVMVQPNMPRFLRAGDRATILASVMNNTDNVAVITTMVESFNPLTSEIIANYTQVDTIVANSSTIVPFDITASFDNTMIGYRVKSTSSTFADGEQSIIPILPSSSPIIESETFYIPADTSRYETQLPKIPTDARVTLQFCENPTWYIVTALPGLRACEETTSMGSAGAIFSAAVAQGIVVNDKDISMAIHRWLASDQSDSTLVSMLQRNQDLKISLLNASPWVTDAMNDTERMTRLALLFNKDEINQTYESNIKLLAKLQRNGGGWAWIDQCDKASVWATLNILTNFGQLKRLNFLRSDNQLNEMIKNAVLFIDRYYAQEFTKYPKGDYTSYLLTRSYFPEIKQSTAASKVTAAQLQHIISEWKKMTTIEKSIAAIILNANGYNATAREILNSIREFAISSQEKGMWWSEVENDGFYMEKAAAGSIILDAFNAVEPNCPEIDKIRQWLILQKEANNWGSSVSTTSAIASILLSGSKWTRPAEGATISIGNNVVTPTAIETATGYFRTNISSFSPSGKTLSIIKPLGYPSWGSVISQYRGNMTDIDAMSSDAVSIEKRFYRHATESDEWVTIDSLRVGDRVKIQLVIKVSREMEYVSIVDERAACFEPVEQLPKPIYSEGLYFYRENRDAATNIYVTHLPKGTYIIDYEMYVNNSGTYSSGVATLQSQYAPQLTTHSSGSSINVTSNNK